MADNIRHQGHLSFALLELLFSVLRLASPSFSRGLPGLLLAPPFRLFRLRSRGSVARTRRYSNGKPGISPWSRYKMTRQAVSDCEFDACPTGERRGAKTKVAGSGPRIAHFGTTATTSVPVAYQPSMRSSFSILMHVFIVSFILRFSFSFFSLHYLKI